MDSPPKIAKDCSDNASKRSDKAKHSEGQRSEVWKNQHVSETLDLPFHKPLVQSEQAGQPLCTRERFGDLSREVHAAIPLCRSLGLKSGASDI